MPSMSGTRDIADDQIGCSACASSKPSRPLRAVKTFITRLAQQETRHIQLIRRIIHFRIVFSAFLSAIV